MSLISLMRFRNAPITVEEAKLNIFAPITKIPATYKNNYLINETIFDNEDYKVKLRGIRLTQIHRDILDIALFYGSYKLEEEIEEKVPVRTFSLYTILEHLGKETQNNQEWLIEKFQELKSAVITLEDKKQNINYEFSIIRASQHSKHLNTFVLVLEELYLTFFESRISINYKELVNDIVNLKHAQTKAVVRYFLTHTQGHQININKLLRKVGIQGTQGNLEKARRKVISELEEVGHKFNIELIKTTTDKRRSADYTVKYNRHEDVKIYYPEPTLF
jgi:hypothetical protein